MSKIVLVGVDPGLVDTGIVMLMLDKITLESEVNFTVVPFTNDVDYTVTDIRLAASRLVRKYLLPAGEVFYFVEKYQPRGNFGTNIPMLELQAGLRRGTSFRFISNTGSKQVLRKELLQLLGLEKFPTTNHQDLQAAARILVWGALKDDVLNTILTEHVIGQLRRKGEYEPE